MNEFYPISELIKFLKQEEEQLAKQQRKILTEMHTDDDKQKRKLSKQYEELAKRVDNYWLVIRRLETVKLEEMLHMKNKHLEYCNYLYMSALAELREIAERPAVDEPTDTYLYWSALKSISTRVNKVLDDALGANKYSFEEGK